jgi:hypothetical protein
VIGRVALAVRGEKQLGSWRLRGAAARAWMQLLPLLRTANRIGWLARSWFALAN